MRAFLVATLAAGLLAAPVTVSTAAAASAATPTTGLPAAGSASRALPTCSGERILRREVWAVNGTVAGSPRQKAAYIHLFYNGSTRTACAFLNSTDYTWGVRKYVELRLRNCVSTTSSGRCISTLNPAYVRGWTTGRSGTAVLPFSRGCLTVEATVMYGGFQGSRTIPSGSVCLGSRV